MKTFTTARSTFAASVLVTTIATGALAQAGSDRSPDFSAPVEAGNRLFFFGNAGLRPQSILYVRDGNKAARVLLDLDRLATNGAVSVRATVPSPNGRQLAYSVSGEGSDLAELRVRDVDSGRDTRDTLEWVEGSGVSWTRDNRGFFYSGYGAPAIGNDPAALNRPQKVYYHRIGTPQSEDLLIYERTDEPGWQFETEVSDDGVFAVITVSEATDSRTRIYYIFLDNPRRPRVNAPVVRLIDRTEAEYDFVHSVGDNFLIRTDLSAPNGRLVRVDINNSSPTRWVTVIPETPDVLQSVNIAGNHLVASYLEDGHSALRVYGMPRLMMASGGRGPSGVAPQVPVEAGTRARGPSADRRAQSAPGYPYIGEIELPSRGTVSAISTNHDDTDLYFVFASPLTPAAIYRHDVRRRITERFNVSFPPSVRQ